MHSLIENNVFIVIGVLNQLFVSFGTTLELNKILKDNVSQRYIDFFIKTDNSNLYQSCFYSVIIRILTIFPKAAVNSSSSIKTK